MVKTYAQLYMDARKSLLEQEDVQSASFMARQLLMQITGKTHAQFLADQNRTLQGDLLMYFWRKPEIEKQLWR